MPHNGKRIFFVVKRLVTALGLGLLMAGCQTKLSEEGENRCLERAESMQNDFVAEKTYENCIKYVMSEIKEEKRIAEEKRVESERIAGLEKMRLDQITEQEKKFEMYANWRFWVSKVEFPDEIVKPVCVVDGHSTELSHTVFKNRYGKRDPSMDSQACMIKNSIVFDKEGFKLIELQSSYGDMGSNPPGPRGGEGNQDFNFPELEIKATYIKCKSKEWLNQPITRLQALRKSDPIVIPLGNGGSAIRVLGTKDPVTEESIDFPKPIWVYGVNQTPYPLGIASNKQLLEKIVNPFCEEHKRFWDNRKKES